MVKEDGTQLGVLSKSDAIQLAKRYGVDLVEIAASAKPPVCQLVDYGKYRYQQSKKQKEKKKTQVGNKLKEIQLSPVIDEHDFAYKREHAIEFLDEEMKVKVSLRFKGRQMAHRDVGMEIMLRFIEELKEHGQADAPPKFAGRAINVVISPVSRSRRSKGSSADEQKPDEKKKGSEAAKPSQDKPKKNGTPTPDKDSSGGGSEFRNDALSGLDLESPKEEKPKSDPDSTDSKE